MPKLTIVYLVVTHNKVVCDEHICKKLCNKTGLIFLFFQYFFIVGSNYADTKFRLLKIRRTDPWELIIIDDGVSCRPNIYIYSLLVKSTGFFCYVCLYFIIFSQLVRIKIVGHFTLSLFVGFGSRAFFVFFGLKYIFIVKEMWQCR